MPFGLPFGTILYRAGLILSSRLVLIKIPFRSGDIVMLGARTFLVVESFTIRKLAQFEISKFQNSFDLFRIDHFLLNFLFEIRFRLAR